MGDGEPQSIEQLLAQAREALGERPTPGEAAALVERGALLVDIREDFQRQRDGTIPGALAVARNVLEWRADPASPHRDDELSARGRRVILVCHEGYQSSLAALTLRRLGLDATDLAGGFVAWLRDGLPHNPPAVR